jgi:hypothetical protein
LNLGLLACKAGVLLLEPHLESVFCFGYFGDGVFQTICLDWPGISILLIVAWQVVRITGVSHLCLNKKGGFIYLFIYLFT